ncbi:MAG: hypothetical protein HKM04_04380 [Legionellales bacterium]|nr:hypothetical protein [Legionellales bacterium]
MKFGISIGLLLILLPLLSLAAGLGDVQVKSYLNQQLDATVPITDLGNLPVGAVSASLASETEFEAVGLKRNFVLSNLAFTVEQNKQQQFYILITSAQPIDKPVLTFLLKLTWPNGKVLREYTVFLDPIDYNSASNQSQPEQKVLPRKPVSTRILTYGPTTMQDNLWAIAQRLLPNTNATINQQMIAILKLNPNAFVQNNINGLKAGYILTLPSTAQATAISDSKAQQLIIAQNAAWQNHTQTTVLPTQQPRQISPLKQQLVLPQTQQPIQPLSVPSLSAPSSLEAYPPNQNLESGNAATTQPNALGNQIALNPNRSNTKLESLENEVAISNAAMQAAVGANQSLQMEISDLRAQLGALQKQLEEKDRTIATLQQNISQEQGGHLTAPTSLQTTAPSQVSNTKKSNWYWILIPLLIVASLFIGFILPKKKIKEIGLLNNVNDLKKQFSLVKKKILNKTKAPEEGSIDQPSSGLSQPVIKPTPLRSGQPLPDSRTLVLTDTTPPNTAMLDIVDEADVYLAYGRYEKAETLLRSSLKNNPDQPGLHLKLLEIYLAKKDKPSFDNELQSLGELTELPLMLQSKLTKLFEGWKNIDLTESSEPENPLLTPVNPTTIENTKKIEEARPPASSGRLMEFDGDLANLYLTLSKMPIQPDNIPTKSETEIEENKLSPVLSEDTLTLQPDEQPKTIISSEMQQTQLALASTYIDMGDTEEASSLLKEVIEKGNEEQKTAAQELAKKIEQQKT